MIHFTSIEFIVVTFSLVSSTNVNALVNVSLNLRRAERYVFIKARETKRVLLENVVLNTCHYSRG